MTVVYLARHGRTALNAKGRLRGHLDPPLDDVGREEVVALGSALAAARPVAVISSPLRRAIETATAVSTRMGLQPALDDRLIDRDYGEFAGEVEADVVERFGSLDAAPGVEPVDAVARRALTALDEAAARFAGPLVLVAHDAVNRALLAELDPALRDVRQRTACWNVLSRETGIWRVELVDQVAG